MICRVLCGPSCKKFQYKFSASNNTFCKATAQPMLVCAQPMLVRASLLAIVTGRLARASIVCELFTFALSINRSSHFIYNIYFSCWTTITRGSRYHMSSHGYPGQACYHRPANCVVAKRSKGWLLVGFSCDVWWEAGSSKVAQMFDHGKCWWIYILPYGK